MYFEKVLGAFQIDNIYLEIVIASSLSYLIFFIPSTQQFIVYPNNSFTICIYISIRRHKIFPLHATMSSLSGKFNIKRKVSYTYILIFFKSFITPQAYNSINPYPPILQSQIKKNYKRNIIILHKKNFYSICVLVFTVIMSHTIFFRQ